MHRNRELLTVNRVLLAATVVVLFACKIDPFGLDDDDDTRPAGAVPAAQSAALAFQSIAPAFGVVSGGTAVTITGTGFVTGQMAVTFNGRPLVGLSVVNATTITGTTPPVPAGDPLSATLVLTKTATAETVNAANAFRYTKSDLNGDGIDDLVAGALGNDAGGADAGRVYVFFGGVGLAGTLGAATANVVVTGEAAGDRFGTAVAVGDVTGDGTADLIVAASRHDTGGADAGRVYVFAGGPALIGALAAGGAATARIDGQAAGDFLGDGGVTAGDVTGDGIADLIAPAGSHDTGGANAGRVYVFAGGATLVGLLGAGASSLARVDGQAADDNLGRGGVAFGDVTGDGIADVLASAPTHDTGGVNAGRTYVFTGGAGLVGTLGAVAASTARIDGQAGADFLGLGGIAAGDVTGDGIIDLMVSAPFHDTAGADAGRTYVFAGGAALAGVLAAGVASAARIDGQAAGDNLGLGGVAAGDVTGDGIVDLMVSAPFHDTAGADAGRTYVFAGGVALAGVLAAGVASTARIDGQAAGDRLGNEGVFGLESYCAGTADVTNDGLPDLIVGAAQHDTGGANAGRVYVVPGGASLAGTIGAAVASTTRIDGEAAADALCVFPPN